MNRIAGICNFDQTHIDPVKLDCMVSIMKLQKQDQPRLLVNGNVGFACISIGNEVHAEDDLSSYHHPNGQSMIVFDGRIDNRRELFAILQSQLFMSAELVSNEEIVLAAYEKWGISFPEHLTGDYAFAIWDKRELRLICVRDHFGVKPFYYSISRDAFVFASTPLAILASGKVPRQIHEDRIADHLVNPLDGVDKTSSFYSDILRLPPAHMLIVHSGGLHIQRYWELQPVVHADLKTENDYIEAFRELFEEAARYRSGDTPATASMLSGGMDSSSVVGMGRKILSDEGKDPLRVFAAISKSPDLNRETPYINSILRQGNLQANLVSETGLHQCMDELVKAIESEAEPFDCLMNLNRSIYLNARDQTFSAVLDGIDGDVLLLGSGHLIQLWREGNFHTIIGETFKADGLTAEYKMGKGLFFNSLLSAYLPFAPDWFRTLRHPYRYLKIVSNAVGESIINHDFAEHCHLGERFATLDSYSPRLRSFSQMDYHKLALSHPFLTVGLERYERVASQFGIEARHPFTDVRLVEFCLGLPWYMKTRRGWTKYILRRAMEPYLPSEVVWRKDKDSLMWEFNRLILKTKREYFHQVTLDERECLKPYVDTKKLEGIWHEYLTLGDEKHAEQIWSGVALAFWLRKHRNMVASMVK